MADGDSKTKAFSSTSLISFFIVTEEMGGVCGTNLGETMVEVTELAEEVYDGDDGVDEIATKEVYVVSETWLRGKLREVFRQTYWPWIDVSATVLCPTAQA